MHGPNRRVVEVQSVGWQRKVELGTLGVTATLSVVLLGVVMGSARRTRDVERRLDEHASVIAGLRDLPREMDSISDRLEADELMLRSRGSLQAIDDKLASVASELAAFRREKSDLASAAAVRELSSTLAGLERRVEDAKALAEDAARRPLQAAAPAPASGEVAALARRLDGMEGSIAELSRDAKSKEPPKSNVRVNEEALRELVTQQVAEAVREEFQKMRDRWRDRTEGGRPPRGR
jgi:hypothetical protein